MGLKGTCIAHISVEAADYSGFSFATPSPFGTRSAFFLAQLGQTAFGICLCSLYRTAGRIKHDPAEGIVAMCFTSNSKQTPLNHSELNLLLFRLIWSHLTSNLCTNIPWPSSRFHSTVGPACGICMYCTYCALPWWPLSRDSKSHVRGFDSPQVHKDATSVQHPRLY